MISADSALSGLDFPAAFQGLKLIRTCSPRVSPRLRASASRSIPPTRCNPDPHGTVGVPLCTEHANLDFPSFQSLPDPKGRNCPAAVLSRSVGAVSCTVHRRAPPRPPRQDPATGWLTGRSVWTGGAVPLDRGGRPRPPAGRPARRPAAGEGAPPH